MPPMAWFLELRMYTRYTLGSLILRQRSSWDPPMVPFSLRIKATFLTVIHKVLHSWILITALTFTTLFFPSSYPPPFLLCL